MKVCPKCGWHEYLTEKCRACGTELNGTLSADETLAERYLRYKNVLDGWTEKRDEFLKFWKDKNSREYYGYKKQLSEMEIFADGNDGFFRELTGFKNFMFGDLPSAEACIMAYLSGRTEDALIKFKEFLSEETAVRIGQDMLYKNIFVYYINIIKCIERNRNDKGSAEQLKNLFENVISAVNSLCQGIKVDVKGAKHSKFRIYRSEKYPDIHDDYIGYLKVLKKAVLGARNESVTAVLGKVGY